MFSKKKRSKQGVEITRLDSFIGSNMSLVGDLTFRDGLRLDGRIEGNVSGAKDEKNLIVLSESSEIAGRVEAYDAVINGTIKGDLVVTHFLELQSKARILGNIRYRHLRMECGAVLEGKLECLDESESLHEIPKATIRKESKSPLAVVAGGRAQEEARSL
ncbi:bactofilin family protein [Ventosimonas gracilis]|uniref:bactofilin family protein n=1 Tax=Ventosimonas gracilis TaxID=1680762 RepID=UPI0009A1E276|nr:polymer-forming cytoskeletal protein [Ventosimonas gracilis]